MGRKIWIVGVAAAVLFAISALTGFSVNLPRRQLQLHLLSSLGSGTLAFFCQLWIVLYLVATDRLLRRTARREGFEAEVVPLLDRLLARTLPVLLPTLGLVVVAVALGGEVYTGRLSAAVHQALGWVALASQGAALAVEKGVLDRHEALVLEVDRRVSHG